MPLYDGPIVDSHHHTIWDCEANYPWMNAPMRPMIFGDDWTGMKQEYSIEQFIADSALHNVVQSVHVQANFDATRPEDETKGLQGFADQHGFPHGPGGPGDGVAAEVHRGGRHRPIPGRRPAIAAPPGRVAGRWRRSNPG